jgi:hypothetical protein
MRERVACRVVGKAQLNLPESGFNRLVNTSNSHKELNCRDPQPVVNLLGTFELSSMRIHE